MRNSKGKQSSEKLSAQALRCKRKFLRFFPKGFHSEKYHNWERDYKWKAHEEWNDLLNRKTCNAFVKEGNFKEIANRAVRIESRTNLLFSFEKMAIRDAIKSSQGARLFSIGLVDFLYGRGEIKKKFEKWCQIISQLPRKQTRVLTWPIVTVFGFIAQPEKHIFLKPMVTKFAAAEYGFDFQYETKPSFQIYKSLLEFSNLLRQDLNDLKPRDMIDIQSFIWVLGSNEYDE